MSMGNMATGDRATGDRATGDRVMGDRATEYESAHQATLPQAGGNTAAPVADQIANQRYLTLALTPIRDALQQFVAPSGTPATPLAEFHLGFCPQYPLRPLSAQRI